MAKPLSDWLEQLEIELERHPADYKTLTDALSDLEVSTNVTSPDLTRLYAACFRVLGIAAGGPPVDLKSVMSERQAAFVSGWAGDIVERTMYDSDASTRAWIARSRERFRARGGEIPDDLNADHLPPRLEIPWDVATASERIRPFFERFESLLAQAPTSHFWLCWQVARDGYPVFRRVMARWLASLDTRGIGMPGTVVALDQAIELYDKSDDVVAISWAECERDVLPLLDDPHPMVAAGAARYLGALYADGCFNEEPQAPKLVEILARLARHSNRCAAVCGSFVCGFDTMCEGLAVLRGDVTPPAAEFDLDRWVIDVLTADDSREYLPNAQSFWFYVHEYYAAKPKFVMRLIDIDRAWVAMMCATDIDKRIKGMRPVLERLAASPDPEIAEPAQAHMARLY